MNMYLEFVRSFSLEIKFSSSEHITGKVPRYFLKKYITKVLLIYYTEPRKKSVT